MRYAHGADHVQAAIAAYACPVDQVSTRDMAHMPDCDSMAETDPQSLCEKHCNPDDSTTPDARVAGAPTAMLLARRARHGIHAQVGAVTDAADLKSALESRPDRTLSRLLCPRRLKPRTPYLACVVPTWRALRVEPTEALRVE